MRTVVLVASLAFPSGCTLEEPAPRLPERRIPETAPLTTPPREGAGRTVVDTDGEPAKVARVVETIEPVVPVISPGWARHGMAMSMRRTELLCVTPCVVDLARGAHTLLFTSLQDPTRTSTGDVVVTGEPTVVLHALGREKPPSGRYVGGFVLTALGGGLLLSGGLMAGMGAAIKPNAKNDPQAILDVGLVIAAVGALAGGTGVVLLTGDRPVHQPGATLQFGER